MMRVVPSQHLPGGHRDAGSGAAQEVCRAARIRRERSFASSPRKCGSTWRSSASARSTRWSGASIGWTSGGPPITGRLKASTCRRCSSSHEVPADVARRRIRGQDHGLERALDHELIRQSAAALDERRPVELHVPIRNAHRAVGTLLGSEITRRYGAAGLPEDRITINFTGSAGQSFGAFLPKGVTLRVRGRRQRWLGQGPLGRQARDPAAGGVHVCRRGQHHRGQRRAVWRDRRRSLRVRPGRRALRGAEQRRASPSSRDSATMAANT